MQADGVVVVAVGEVGLQVAAVASAGASSRAGPSCARVEPFRVASFQAIRYQSSKSIKERCAEEFLIRRLHTNVTNSPLFAIATHRNHTRLHEEEKESTIDE